MGNNKKELESHFQRNESMWQAWEAYGVNSDTLLTVNFHFYTPKKANMDNLCKELEIDELTYRVKQKRTLLFFKGWEVEADVTQKWTLPLLQAKTGRMFIMSKQTEVSLEGCGATIP